MAYIPATGKAKFNELEIVANSSFGGSLTENVYAVSGTTPALSPSNGTIQTWTLSDTSTPTAKTI